MGNEFVPKNDLERALLKAKQGELPFNELLAFVMNQQIMVLSKTVELNKISEKRPKMGDPLVVYGQNDEPQIAAFTSMNRAKEKVRARPEYEYVSEFPCGELFGSIAEGVGLVINPNDKVGMQLDSVHVHQLKVLLSRKISGDGKSQFVFDEEFAPENDLESALLKAQMENAHPTSILQEIINSDLIVLAKGSNVEDPLFVTRSDGVHLLVTFSAESRSKERQAENPEHKFAVELKCGSLLLGIPEGAGLVINPGIRVGLVLPPEMVTQIKQNIKSD